MGRSRFYLHADSNISAFTGLRSDCVTLKLRYFKKKIQGLIKLKPYTAKRNADPIVCSCKISKWGKQVQAVVVVAVS